MTGKVVALGELLLRLSPPGKQLIVQSHAMDIAVGGAEANVLAGLSALGRQTFMISVVADNRLGALAISALRARGVDTNAVKTAPGRMGLYFYEAGHGRRTAAIVYDRQHSAFAQADWADLDLAGMFAGASLLHLSGITPALGQTSAEVAVRAAKAARELGVPVSFDCNFRPQLWEAWSADPAPILRQLIAEADVLFGNHRDVALLTTRSFSGVGTERRREAAMAALEAFPNLRLIASTARCAIDSDHHQISARTDTRDDHAETEEVSVEGIVDRIGTGDAFATGVLHAWLDGRNCLAMARTGLALCALKHGIHGDMSYSTEDDAVTFWNASRDVRR